ncbi:MAG: DUF4214 domain-containing protein [Acidimicrobiales bacterium]|nr:DUF4214 domain-containing protein [Acidimicrobiales bacterium]
MSSTPPRAPLMPAQRRRGLHIVRSIGVLLVLLAAATPAFAEESNPIERRSVAGIAETIDGRAEPAVLTRPARSRTPGDGSAQARLTGPARGRRIDGTMTTTYEAPTPLPVRQVIDAAVARWDDALDLSPTTPLEISVLWTDLGQRLLGQAGTEGEYRDSNQFPTDRWYPAALANQLANFDVNGADSPEVMIELNSELGDEWYIGTEGSPAFGQIDLFSVVLHEIAHGLGFLGSATATRTGQVRLDHSPPSIYDDFVLNSEGDRLVQLPRDVAIDELTSGSLKFDIGGGRSVPLSAPERFVNGSSYSHFDEGIPEDQPGAMMTPALGNGEIQRHLDAAVLGVLDQVGWDLDARLLTPTIEDVEVRSGQIELVWSEDWTQVAALPLSYDVTVGPLTSSGPVPDSVGRSVAGGHVGVVRFDELQNGTTYEVSVRPVGANVGRPATTTVLLPPNPNRVRDLAIDVDGDRALVWRTPVASGEPVSSYEIQHREGSQTEWRTETATSPRWTIDLEPGRYWFRVRGVNRIGGGVWAETGLIGIGSDAARPMPLDGQLARLYTAFFDRPADRPGLDYWREIRSGGGSLGAVAEAFADSEEFRTRYGGALSDSRFLELLYRNVLGRLPDRGGADYWMDVLDAGAARGQVVLAFSESSEFVRTSGTTAPQTSLDGAIERLHVLLLRRTPTAQDFTSLRPIAGSGDGPELALVSARLRRSPEFAALWDELDDADLIHQLGRSVGLDAKTLSDLHTRLADGESIDRLIVEITQAPAMILVTGTIP